jgi:hypothetical protein
MTFNINDMRSQLVYGGAKSTLFQVNITNPVNPVGDIKIPFMVQAASLPESQIGAFEVPYFGRKIKMAGDRTFSPWTVTVINDEDFAVRNALEEWSNSINSHTGNLRLFGSASASQYKSQAQVTQYSKTGQPIRVYNFNGLFPTDITAIGLDWSNVNSYETFQVTFQYDWWDVVGGSTGNANTQQ